jgi:hypothetical protein
MRDTRTWVLLSAGSKTGIKNKLGHSNSRPTETGWRMPAAGELPQTKILVIEK